LSVATLAFTVGGWWPLGLVFGFLTFLMGFCFRNPERLPPIGSAMVASPADGRVVFVGPALEDEFGHLGMLKVAIHLSFWDVHINRVPVDGTVRNMKYHRGRFMACFEERISEENERNHVLIETAKGEKVIVVQVAGLFARRIVCYPTIGAFILRGQRMGMIRFGSRTDIYLPPSAEIRVKLGDRVLGGETILAELKEEPSHGAP
jgi:phosphatidylserine decarboxylase